MSVLSNTWKVKGDVKGIGIGSVFSIGQYASLGIGIREEKNGMGTSLIVIRKFFPHNSLYFSVLTTAVFLSESFSGFLKF